MFAKREGIGALFQDYLDRWLQIQVAQRPEKRSNEEERGGMVMACGPCAERKQDSNALAKDAIA